MFNFEQVKVLYYNVRGGLFAIQMDEIYFYVASDHLGTPLAVLSSGLSVVKEVTTAPYGEVIMLFLCYSISDIG